MITSLEHFPAGQTVIGQGAKTLVARKRWKVEMNLISLTLFSKCTHIHLSETVHFLCICRHFTSLPKNFRLTSRNHIPNCLQIQHLPAENETYRNGCRQKNKQTKKKIISFQNVPPFVGNANTFMDDASYKRVYKLICCQSFL